jgi:hypothetical protein
LSVVLPARRRKPSVSASAALLFAATVSACGGTVTRLTPTGTDERPRRFRIECIELDQCKEKATAACGSQYQVVSEWHNTIPESELPGLNELSRPKDVPEWNPMTLPRATGIESEDPMPLASIVVACNA